MSDDELKEKIKKYAKMKGKVTLSEIQVEFNLDFKHASSIVQSLCEEKFMDTCDGTEYEVHIVDYMCQSMEEQNNSISEIYDEEERFMLKYLAFCIINKKVKLTDLLNSMKCGYYRQIKVLDWLRDNRYICFKKIEDTQYYVATLSEQKFAEKFGIYVVDAFKENYNNSVVNFDAGKGYSPPEEYRNSNVFLKRIIYILSSPDTSSQYLYKTRRIFPHHGKAFSKEYRSLFFSLFDMKEAILNVPQLDRFATEKILVAKTDLKYFGKHWSKNKYWESLCIEVIVNIVGMNQSWERLDAVQEAAREAIAIKYSDESNIAYNIHNRALYELLSGSDEDYECLNKIIWE